MYENEPKDLDWVQLRKEMGTHDRVETTTDRISRKFNENPFVPIGCLATVGALSYGLWSFRTGQKKLSQQMMRWRIVAQGFTLTSIIIGVMLTTGRSIK